MRISIVTVVLNAERTIADALHSVASQTYQDVEHLLIDGGSKDGTLAIARQRGSHLCAIVSEPDQGLYDAMNKGARFATGEVLGFLNADDFYAESKTLEKVADIFCSRTVDVCFGDLQYVDRLNVQRVLRHWEPGAFFPGRFASGWAPPHPTFFVRRSVFQEVGGFNRKFQLASDNDLMMRILECHGYKSHYLNEVLVKMRIGGKTNRSLRNILRGNREILSSLHANGIKVNILSYAVRKVLLKIKHRFVGMLKKNSLAY